MIEKLIHKILGHNWEVKEEIKRIEDKLPGGFVYSTHEGTGYYYKECDCGAIKELKN